MFPKKGKPKAAGYPDMHISSNNFGAEEDNQEEDDNGNYDQKEYGDELEDDMMDMEGLEQ